MNSRIKNNQTKLAHVRYLYRFLEGLEEPDNFFYFKQKDKWIIERERYTIERKFGWF